LNAVQDGVAGWTEETEGKDEIIQKVAVMSFTIETTSALGPMRFTCSTASETMNKVCELEQHPHGSILVRDGSGRAINIDELTALCDAESR
jgi:hypothetical protein